MKRIHPLKKLPSIVITLGDPAGIGPEIITKLFFSGEIASFSRALVVGDAKRLAAAANITCPALSINSISKVQEAQFRIRTVDVIDLDNVPKNFVWGYATPEGGKAAVEYIQKATDLALKGDIDAIVTSPINKKALALAGFHWPGHTELLAEHTKTQEVALMMLGRNLRVSLVTLHIPLQDVVKKLTIKAIEQTIQLTYQWIINYVTNSPKIAVTGLNPHCGDGGRFGKEEENIIIPAIENAKDRGINVSGPFSADSFFGHGQGKEYDAVVTMYHDQGLIPVKMDAMGEAVNITLGLPILRTSVDHGTAYDIAGKNLASSKSLLSAIKTAANFSNIFDAFHEKA